MVLVYGLYRESLKENYGLDNLLRWLMRDEGKAGEGPEKLLEEKEEYRSRSSSGRNGYPGKWDSQPEILDGEKGMSPGPEKTTGGGIGNRRSCHSGKCLEFKKP